MNLLGNKIILRPLEVDDMPLLYNMINDAEMEKMVGGWSKPVSMQSQIEWFNKIGNSSDIRYAIAYNESTIGCVTIRSIDWKNRSASLDIKISKNYCNLGLGKDTIKTILKYCFNELNLHRIFVIVLEYNLASKKMFESCGFKEDGLLRESIYKDGCYHSQVIMSILKDEFL